MSTQLYVIKINYYYYPGTFYARKSGWARLGDDGDLTTEKTKEGLNAEGYFKANLPREILAYATIEAAQADANRYLGRVGSGGPSYVCRHGEYAQPGFEVRKLPSNVKNYTVWGQK